MFALVRKNTLFRNTGWMVVGHASRALMQGIYFVVLARALTATGYGRFVGAASVVAIAAPFSGLGSGNLLVQSASRDRSTFARYWGQALILVFLSGSLLLVVILWFWVLFLKEVFPLTLIMSVALADVFCARLADISAQAFQAVERLRRTAQIYMFVHLARLAGALCLLMPFTEVSVTTWSVLYLGGSAISSGVAIWLVNSDIGRPQMRYQWAGKELWLGFHFSVGLSAQSIYNDIDKSLLVKMSALESAGVYGAAYRVIDAAFTPVRALLAATYARFFKHGAKGIDASMAYARRLGAVAGVYALGAGICVALLSPILPSFLGRSFFDLPEAVRWLAVIPLIRVLHYFPADALTGAGYQGPRSGIQGFVAVVNILLNVWLIPFYGWRGAAGASLVSDGLLALGLWALVLVVRKRQRGGVAHIVPADTELKGGS